MKTDNLESAPVKRGIAKKGLTLDQEPVKTGSETSASSTACEKLNALIHEGNQIFWQIEAIMRSRNSRIAELNDICMPCGRYHVIPSPKTRSRINEQT